MFSVQCHCGGIPRWPGGIVVSDDPTTAGPKQKAAKAKPKPKAKQGAKNRAAKSSSGGGPRKDVKTYSTSYTQIQQFPVSWLLKFVWVIICEAARLI